MAGSSPQAGDTAGVARPVTILLNGERQDVAVLTTVASLVEHHLGRRDGIAVAVNGEVVPRSSWDRRFLSVGDAVEVVTAVAGG